MGGGSYSSTSWDTFSDSRGYHDPHTTVDHIYSSRSINPDLDPKKFKFRESVDSADNPESTPVIIALDVTGSMTPVLDSIARKGLKTICEEIYDRKPITNPHICTLGIGDVECDSAPLQATQFEADIRIFKQLEEIWLERGGGGNYHESYILAWYFAMHRVASDSFRKRGRKGFIFTIGDEEITPSISSNHLSDHLGDSCEGFSAQSMFDLTFPEWEIFHIIVKEGSHASRNLDKVVQSWTKVLGQRAVQLSDHTKVGELVVSLMEMTTGKSAPEVVDSWDGDTSVILRDSIKDITISSPNVKPVDEYL